MTDKLRDVLLEVGSLIGAAAPPLLEHAEPLLMHGASAHEEHACAQSLEVLCRPEGSARASSPFERVDYDILAENIVTRVAHLYERAKEVKTEIETSQYYESCLEDADAEQSLALLLRQLLE